MEWVSAAILPASGLARYRRLLRSRLYRPPGRSGALVRRRCARPSSAKFRDPHADGPDAFKDQHLRIPMMLGDGINFDGSPLQWFQFPKLQYAMLQHWADGDFRR